VIEMTKETKRMAMATRRNLALFAAVLAGVATLAAIDAGSASAKASVDQFTIDRSTSQAGGHPDVDISLVFTTKEFPNGFGGGFTEPDECYCEDPKRIAINFPTGFIGNPHAVPKCNLAELGLGKCPPDSQVGIASALFGMQFLYNMEPRPGEPGLLASQIPLIGTPVFTILRGRTNDDYGLTAETPDIYHLIGLVALQIHVWGVPADPIHNFHRAPIGLQKALCPTGGANQYPAPCFEAPTPASSPPAPYLQNPTSCEGPLTASVDAEYYNHEVAHAEASLSETASCDLLGFSPALTANPTTKVTDSPSGIDINIKVPQTQSPTVPSPSELRKSTIVLPEGFSVNPNAADGKTVCKDADSGIGTLGPARCPEASKVGLLTISSSALPAPIDGAMYLAEPQPGNRYRLLLTASGFETHVKLPGSVSLDPQTGRIVVTFDNLPQSPLQEFDMHVFGAERGLLATPERCGTYTVDSEFVPWAAVLGAQNSSTSFEINGGPNGLPCTPAGSSRGFKPSLVAGSPDNTAGSFSPFAIKVDRNDGDQNLAAITVRTPPGFLASLKGVPYCSEAAITQLRDPAYLGKSEEASSVCPAASQVGVATTASGTGSRPLSTPGRVYLAGPYKGAPISVVTVIPAVSGPYDLGNVAVRSATFVDPVTAQVTTVSDPLPQIVDGIPLRVRSVLVNLNRPDFALNPTNCSPFSIETTIFGDEGGQASPSAFYQVANCAVLPFAPKLVLKLVGSTKRRGHPALQAVVAGKPGEANLKRAVVTMPKTLLLDNAHIGNVCTRPQFAADACPPASALGKATATTSLLDDPLTGTAYLRSSSNPLPDLVIDLEGQVDIEVVGRIDSTEAGGLRTTFDAVPDAPVEGFTLNLEGGSKGLLVNSVNLCKAKPSASISLVGQNGVGLDTRNRLQTSCTARRAKAKKGKRRGHQRVGRSGAVG
jgi:hypothetical protein